MPLTISDEMFERLVALITEARVAAEGARQEVALLRQERDRDYAELKGAVSLLQAGFAAVEEDLTAVQKALRDQSVAFGALAVEVSGLTQAVDGITQLTKSNFDQLESLRKQVYGEQSSRHEHGEEAGHA